MNDTLTTCANCSDEIDTENDLFYGSEENGQTYCPGCHHDDLANASTAFVTGPDYPESPQILIGEWFIEDNEGDPWTGEFTFQRSWRASDGWRGFWETTIDGWTEILSGWTTGGWGDPTGQRKDTFNRWAESLFTGKIVPPVNVAIITDPTSNLFSTAIGVFVPTDSVETFTEWVNGELDNLRYALS